MTRGHKHSTLSEVARLAGVGTTTVSRVINGGQRVDPKTLARVRRAIDADPPGLNRFEHTRRIALQGRAESNLLEQSPQIVPPTKGNVFRRYL